VARRVEQLEGLDRIAEPVQSGVRKAIPEPGRGKDLLSGTWLGHPLHPLLTDVVIGAWASALALDVLGGTRRGAADDLVGIGALAALPAAIAGLSDWSDLKGRQRRVGTVHAAGNLVALALQSCSWQARRRGRHATGVALSTVAMATASASAWLGGHLTFGEGVGVDQTAFETPPSAWTAVIDADRLENGELVRRSARGTGVVLVRHRGAVHALVDRCSHRGCSLSEGSFDGTSITCACHGSRFGLGGELLEGPATAPQPTLETRIHDGKVEVRARQDDR
jgi:nitrite reductase/ring-hydroxylating ferredoxin subunit/uncharacterized membrane protein